MQDTNRALIALQRGFLNQVLLESISAIITNFETLLVASLDHFFFG
jgi:hypothetical protein